MRKYNGNAVSQHPMVQHLVPLLWGAMMHTGNGYMRHKLGRTGEGEDRRADKLGGESKFMRSYRKRYS